MLTRLLRLLVILNVILLSFDAKPQLFQDDFGTAFTTISTVNWPTACRGGTPSSYNTSVGACSGTSDYSYSMSGFGKYITTSAISIPSTGYALSFSYLFNYSLSFPTVEIRTGASCGTTLQSTTTLTQAATCSPQSISLDAFAGQTIYIRFVSNTSSSTFYLDDVLVDASGSSGGGGCLLQDDFGTAFASISTTNWPTACRSGSPSSFNTSVGSCSGAGDYSYGMSGYVYITSMALSIPATGYSLDFTYSYNNTFSFPAVEIRSGGTCGTSLLSSTTLTNTSGSCNPQSINLDLYAGQTIFIRFVSNSSTATFYLDDVSVCGSSSGPVGDFKWADNFNDNNTTLDYAGTDGDEACTGCGPWNLAAGATLNLVPSSGWNGNTNETEAFVNNMSNVYYVRLDRNEYIESPVIDMSAMESLKISFYAKSSSAGTGGGDSWSSVSDHLRLQIWDGTSWITVKDITEGAAAQENQITPALPFNYFCFSAYKSSSSPGNYYYSSTPNVNSAYFHSGFKFRVIFEGGFSGAPFAWVDDFTFRADADGYSTMVPCGISFWNQPMATSYGQDTGTTGNNNAEKGVELELDGSISVPPLWATQANDGDTVTQIFGSGEAERIVFAVISEQRIQFAFPQVFWYAPSTGWQSTTMSVDNSYSGPGWRYYAIEYVSCDLASSTIALPSNDIRYYYSFEYGNEFIPVYYQLNTSGIETGGGVTASYEVFNAPDVVSSDDCGLTALGVEWISFTGAENAAQIDLNWIVGSERNNDGFYVERSKDGSDFEALGFVKGKGTSNEKNSYVFTDFQPVPGINYYRIKQVDFDGKVMYSNTIAVNRNTDGLLVYPNPADDFIHLISSGKSISQVSIVSSEGKTTEVIQADANETAIDLRNYDSGIYFFQILFSDGTSVVTKVIH